MDTTRPLRLHGALGSPYSLKVRAALRYRRIPFLWIEDVGARQALLDRVKAPVIPLLEFPDGRVANDSTPLLEELDRALPGRELVAPEPGHAFLAALVEDFADEWLVKAMFLSRWATADQADLLGLWLAFDMLPGAGRGPLAEAAKRLRDRQVGRMPLVGCTPENVPLIDRSWRRLLAILEAHLADGWFLFGTRPTAAEFALFGQLAELASDPVPGAVMRAEAPLVTRWVAHLDDLSGLEGAWGPPAPVVEPILALVGEVYLPFLVANAEAVAAGAAEFRFTALGLTFAQAPSRYQAKCLHTLRTRLAALDPSARAAIAPLLARTGCLAPLAP
ncbi:glutathione S-transferase [Thermaurantiacus sp.]